MKCKNGHDSSLVVDTRQIGDQRRRRYRCTACGDKFSTMEIPHRIDKRRKHAEEAAILRFSKLTPRQQFILMAIADEFST